MIYWLLGRPGQFLNPSVGGLDFEVLSSSIGFYFLSLSWGLKKGRDFSCSCSGSLPRILDGGGASVEGNS